MARGLALLAAALLALVALPAQADVVVRGSCPDGAPVLEVPWNYADLETCVPALANACVPEGDVGGTPVPETCVVVPPPGSVPSIGTGPALPDFPPALPPVEPPPPPAGLPEPLGCVVNNTSPSPNVTGILACAGAPPVEPPGGTPPLPPPLDCVVASLGAPETVGACLPVPAPTLPICLPPGTLPAPAPDVCVPPTGTEPPPVEPPTLPFCLPAGTLPDPAPDPLCIPPGGEPPPVGDLPGPVACLADAAQTGAIDAIVECAVPAGTLPPCIDALLADPSAFDPATCAPEGTEPPPLPVDPCDQATTPDLSALNPAFDAIDGAAGQGTTQGLRDAVAQQPLPAQPADVLGPAGLCPPG